MLEDSAIVVDADRLQTALAEVEAARTQVDTLYARWAELEAKQN
jgi:ubiquinone biosynthesis protein UbiJ